MSRMIQVSTGAAASYAKQFAVFDAVHIMSVVVELVPYVYGPKAPLPMLTSTFFAPDSVHLSLIMKDTLIS